MAGAQTKADHPRGERAGAARGGRAGLRRAGVRRRDDRGDRARAGVPKANLHYYFPTKEALYRAVIERVLTAWLDAASSFDASEDAARGAVGLYRRQDGPRPRDAARLAHLVGRDHARRADHPGLPRHDAQPNGSPSARRAVRRWIAAGKLKPIEPKVLFYMIWATTQQYANAAHEIATLNGGQPLDDAALRARQAPGDRDHPGRGGGVMQAADGASGFA